MSQLRYAQIGAATGLRSMMGPAQVSLYLAELPRDRRPAGALSSFLARDGVRDALRLAALGEIIADKLPIAPDRIEPGPLLGRLALGAMAGGALAEVRGEPIALGAVLGGIGAAIGAFTGYHARRSITDRSGVPDLAVALCEDTIAVIAARHALRD